MNPDISAAIWKIGSCTDRFMRYSAARKPSVSGSTSPCGNMNTWNFLTNEFSRVETGYLEKIPQDNTPEFTLPEDFNMGSNEHIIASGKVDEKSFYVVTCQSLRLITKEE